MRKAVFLDRDGTINKDIGDLYSAEKLEFIPNALKALKQLQRNFLLFIVTNQAAIGNGVYTQSEFEKFNRHYLDKLSRRGIRITRVYCCPHRPQDNCICRKPSPYFIREAEKEFNLDLKSSFFAGDHPSDVEAGLAAGLESIFLLTGHGRKHLDEVKAKKCFIAEDIYHAAQWIDKQLAERGL
ncbi:MAG: D-glycero-alpha-D-manno-heptose-1,7-bisphosphate 7-phosphatase [Actinomycetota bacterium]